MTWLILSFSMAVQAGMQLQTTLKITYQQICLPWVHWWHVTLIYPAACFSSLSSSFSVAPLSLDPLYASSPLDVHDGASALSQILPSEPVVSHIWQERGGEERKKRERRRVKTQYLLSALSRIVLCCCLTGWPLPFTLRSVILATTRLDSRQGDLQLHPCTHTHDAQHTRMHTHTRTYARTHTHAHTHTHARTHTRTHAHAHAHAHTHTHTHIPRWVWPAPRGLSSGDRPNYLLLVCYRGYRPQWCYLSHWTAAGTDQWELVTL